MEPTKSLLSRNRSLGYTLSPSYMKVARSIGKESRDGKDISAALRGGLDCAAGNGNAGQGGHDPLELPIRSGTHQHCGFRRPAYANRDAHTGRVSHYPGA